MKANELRIGNLVQTNYEGFINVVNINSEGFDYIDFRKSGFKAIGRIELEYVEPIPLTEEWLLKFGFKKWGRDDMPRTVSFELVWIKIFPANSFCDFKGYGFMYYKKEESNSVESARVVIQYVHQLQNLYFALTGEESQLK